jgi:hypothetical protein
MVDNALNKKEIKKQLGRRVGLPMCRAYKKNLGYMLGIFI